MAKSRLNKVAASIGTAVGTADKAAHKMAGAGVVARKELHDIAKELDSLKKQLQKTAKRLKKALT
jgi:hypothetical protein